MDTKPFTRVRAKFYVTGVTEGSGYRTYNLQPVYSPDPSTENGKFWEASPSGKAQFSAKIGDETPWPAFEIGKKYYFDFEHLDVVADAEPEAGDWFISSIKRWASGQHKDSRNNVNQIEVHFNCIGYSGFIDITVLNKAVFDQYELGEFQKVTVYEAPDDKA